MLLHGAGGLVAATMAGVRIVLRLFWKTLTRLLRRFGWGGLLVPVAAMGMALYGVTLWTVAAVVRGRQPPRAGRPGLPELLKSIQVSSDGEAVRGAESYA